MTLAWTSAWTRILWKSDDGSEKRSLHMESQLTTLTLPVSNRESIFLGDICEILGIIRESGRGWDVHVDIFGPNDSGPRAREPGGGGGAIAPQLFVSMGWIWLWPPP